MAINRFRGNFSQLDPTIYSYQQQEYIPDISALSGVTTGLQGIYDQLDYLDIPKHLQEDIPEVQSRYIQPVEELKNKAVDAFTSGDTGTGIRSFKDIQRFLHKAKQPGGVYQQFEQSYGAYQDYVGQLDKLYEQEKIGADRRELLKQFSRDRFKGSFQGDTFTPFSGISAAFEQDRLTKGLEIGKGWKANKFPQGVYKTPQGYFNAQTKEFVDPKEVLGAVYSGLLSDQSIINDLQQEALLQGLKGEDAVKYMNDELKRVAAVVAEKEGFEQIDQQFLRDWMTQDSLAHQRKMREIEYEYMLPQEQMQTGLIDIKVEGALPKLKDGQIQIEPYQVRTGRMGLEGLNPGKTINKGFDNMLKTNPDYFKQYPGFDKVIENLPRKTVGNDPESNESYNKRVLEQYKSYRESHTTAIGYSLLNADQAEKTKDKVTGKGKESLGDLENRRILIIHPEKGLQEVELSDLMDQAGTGKDIATFKDRLTFFGEKTAASPGTPSGYMGSITIPGKGKRGSRTLQFIASPDNIQNKTVSEPLYELTSVEWSPGKFESDVVKYPFADGVYMKSKKDFVEDQNGNLVPVTSYFEVEYIPKFDEEGKPILLEDGSIDFETKEHYLGPKAKQELLLDMEMKNKMKSRELDTDVTMEPARRAKITQQVAEDVWQN
jgi:ASC-1-like (ASCH) protein